MCWADCQIKIRQIKKQAFWPNLPNIIPANCFGYMVFLLGPNPANIIPAKFSGYNYIRALIKLSKIGVKYVGNQTSFKFVKISDEA